MCEVNRGGRLFPDGDFGWGDLESLRNPSRYSPGEMAVTGLFPPSKHMHIYV